MAKFEVIAIKSRLLVKTLILSKTLKDIIGHPASPPPGEYSHIVMTGNFFLSHVKHVKLKYFELPLVQSTLIYVGADAHQGLWLRVSLK